MIVYVTTAQVHAARVMVRRWSARGETVRPAVRKIAEARTACVSR